MTAEQAIQELAKRLYEHDDRLDPGFGDPDADWSWEGLDDHQRRHWELLVEDLLLRTKLLDAALRTAGFAVVPVDDVGRVASTMRASYHSAGRKLVTPWETADKWEREQWMIAARDTIAAMLAAAEKG